VVRVLERVAHDLIRDVGYRPATPVDVGVKRFVDWFCEYYGYKR
jgi:UDP-glucuronate 4-epimerase